VRAAIVAASLAVATLAGCAGSPARLAMQDPETLENGGQLCTAYQGSISGESREKYLALGLSRGWLTERDLRAIREGSVFVGMSRAAAYCSWGQPDHINKSTGSYGRSEQWVYGAASRYSPSRQYLYLENDRVSGTQTSNRSR